jgi:hypothetical protein
MIEWVPIKDFKCDDERQFLILLCGKQFKDDLPQVALCLKNDQKDYRYHQGCRVTHAAKINFPVEKTLEEKLHDHCKATGVHSDRYILDELAKIAKDHYESKE